MPFDFDDTDMPEEPKAQAQAKAVDKAMKEFDLVDEEDEYDEAEGEISEVERRIELAQYYMAIRNQNFFKDDDSESADIVSREISTFIRQRLEVLMGIKQEKKPEAVQPPLFSPDEVDALKRVAGKVIGKPAVLDKPVTPTAQPIAVAATPAPVKGPPVVTQVEAPVRRGRGRPRRDPNAPVVIKAKAAVKAAVDRPPGVPTDAEQGDDGRWYRKHVKSDGKVVLMDVTPQAKPVGAKPFPTPTKQQMTMLSEQSANESVMKAQSQTGLISQAIAAALSKE